MEYEEHGVCVSPSTHGLGVFATKPFAECDLIGPIAGTVIDDPAYQSDYCMELGQHSALEPAPPFRFVNHSCQPNCGLLEMETDADGPLPGAAQLWLEVLRDIPAGVQLTIDYAWPAWAAVPCGCGCPECRNWIVAAEQIDRVAARRKHGGVRTQPSLP